MFSIKQLKIGEINDLLIEDCRIKKISKIKFNIFSFLLKIIKGKKEIKKFHY